jgi:hypothetical protein
LWRPYVDDLAFVTKPYGIFMNFRIGILKKIKSVSFLKSAQRYTSLKDTVVFSTFSSTLDKTQYREPRTIYWVIFPIFFIYLHIPFIYLFPWSPPNNSYLEAKVSDRQWTCFDSCSRNFVKTDVEKAILYFEATMTLALYIYSLL